MTAPPVLRFIRQYGFWRGIWFRSVARQCDQDPKLLKPWSARFRAKASDRFFHGDEEAGLVYLVFAETLASAYVSLVLMKKPKRRILNRQVRRMDKRVRKKIKKGRA